MPGSAIRLSNTVNHHGQNDNGQTSLQAFLSNTLTLLLWAAIIVVLTLLGFATLLFGLLVIMPILGHASWHAYRDLVE